MRMPHKKAMRKILSLLSEELAIEIGHKGVLVEVTDGQCHLRCHDDMTLVHLDNALQVDDIGAVGAHELVAGQALFHLLHAQQGSHWSSTVAEVYAQVLAHRLDIEYIVDGDAHNLVLGL